MSEEERFWWNWWVNFGVAIGTLATVLAALFGDWLKAKLFQPNLNLELVSPGGNLTTAVLLSPTGETRQESARYYHVRVSNLARWPSATQLQVFLIRIEVPGPDGELILEWAGDIPLRWKFQEIQPISRTVGLSADCDLCSVIKGKWLELHPLIVPNNLTARRNKKTDMVVSLQARSNEGESPIRRFRISWDGQWEDGESEMTRHLVIKDLV